MIDQVLQPLVHRKIREALREVDGTIFGRQLGHLGEDGGGDLGEFGRKGHNSFL